MRGSGHVSADGWSVLRRGLCIAVIAAREQRRAFAAGVLGSTLFAAAAVGTAFAISAAVARYAAPAFRTHEVDLGAAAAVVVLVLLVTAMKVGGTLIRRIAVGHLQFGLVADYRFRLLRQYLELPYAWHLRESPGGLLSIAASDVDAAWFVVSALPLAVGAVTICVIATGALLFTDPLLAAVGVCVLPAMIVVNVSCSRRLVPYLTVSQELRAELAGIVKQNIDGAQVVRALGSARTEVERFRTSAQQLRDASVAAARVRASFNLLVEGLPSLGSLAMLLIGVVRLRAHAIDIEALLSATLLFSCVAFPIAGIGWMLGLIPMSVVGWDRMQRVLTQPGNETSARSPSLVGRRVDVAMHLEIREVTYRYDSRRIAVDDVTLTVEPGRTLGIAGTTGAGKSTLVRMIVGLLVPSTGEILLDGADVRTFAPKERPFHVGYVPQETFLFADTVRGNLALDLESDLPDSDLWCALEISQAAEFVTALPGRLETTIGERGGTLSGGQRQRLAIARAVVRRPRLLVLDDATSGVDPVVETAILGSLRAELSTTTVMVTDRHKCLAQADEVAFFDAGRLVARGRHEELLAHEVTYASLVRAHGVAV
jgi:ATP-binding cassette, subfamily B, bacterial